MYGRRGRIGLMVPTGNSVVEPEFQRMAPDGVSTHANRVELKDVTPDSLLAMENDTARSARQIAQTRLGVIAFACTSGSFVGGAGYDDRLIKMIEDETGIAATTTTTAVVRALRLLNVSRIALATPYTDEVTKLEVEYLNDNGFEVTAWQGGGITDTADIQECEPEVSFKRALEVDNDRAEAVFISCTGFRTIENIAGLEAELGKPVISSNQATFADCLRILDMHEVAPGYGSLFEKTFERVRGTATSGKASRQAAE
ncbi:aspartate/glutamate racemase family protein [Anderseniella sp. Alg231-50]|uniref:aspartate racemase/maleate isomerase family protein n=1 Tax=Anderseniella sp. Alg231-50 TaxID=1922226 RepID=UPI000D54B361